MLDEIVAKLKKYTVAEIAYKTGMSVSTVSNIISGANRNPNMKTVEALQNFLKTKEQKNELSSKSKKTHA